MMRDDTTIHDPARARDAVEPYEPPAVTILGSIAELTASGAVGLDDGAGFGELGGS